MDKTNEAEVIAMLNGFIRAAAATPKIRAGDCAYNAGQIISLIKKAESENIRLICMPALCITGCSCGDLFLLEDLLESAENALKEIIKKTTDCNVLAVIGLPIAYDGQIYNAAAVCYGGKVLGFTAKGKDVNGYRFFNGDEIVFNSNLIFQNFKMPAFKMAVIFGDDCLIGDAAIAVNISASAEEAGKAAKRRSYCETQSEMFPRGYVYANAGYGESTTDAVYSGHNIICENGEILAESAPFGDGWAVSEIDLHAINHERNRRNIFGSRAGYTVIPFSQKASGDVLYRPVSASPFMPDKDKTASLCEEILQIQTHGLVKRLEHTGACAVLGISGGLDSTLALIVTVRAYEKLGLDKSKIIAVTMPCFGTTKRTKSNAHRLCEALGVTCREIDITETVTRHLRDINHPEDSRDITYENAQARVRTLVLMDLANRENGIVIGSGNLSELALGWATYNGDHMSMYGVNAGVPKTAVREVIKHTAEIGDLSDVLYDILSTPISPELLPPKDGEIIQETESIVGPYALHDFFIYHTLRHGRGKTQMLELARIAFDGRFSGEEIEKWLKIFYKRFYSQQFKRNCLPDGPQIFSVSLSPRNGWRMPSDVSYSEP